MVSSPVRTAENLEPIWLATGQSNMETFGTEVLPGAEHVQVQQFSEVFPKSRIPKWTPLPAVATRFSAVAGAFAASLATITTQPVRIIAVARGGTEILCWIQKNGCLKLLRKATRKQSVAGVIWWQGEADALTYKPEVIAGYEMKLRRVFESWRREFRNPQLPIVMVGLQRYCNNWPNDGQRLPTCEEPSEWKAIRNTQHKVADSMSRVAFVDLGEITSGALHPREQYAEIGRLLAQNAVTLKREIPRQP